MQNYIKLITIITLFIFSYACSNNSKHETEEETLPTPVQEVETENTDAENNQAQPEDMNDFRVAKWGMSMEEVIELEPEPPKLKKDNTLDYSTIMLDKQVQIGYTFENDKLIRAGFYFLTEPDTKNGYIETYDEVKELLTEANGQPFIDTIKQKDPSQKIDEEQMGEAICKGDVLYASQWNLPRTDIQLVLRGEDSECHLTIVYLSKELMRQMIEQRLQKPNQDG